MNTLKKSLLALLVAVSLLLSAGFLLRDESDDFLLIKNMDIFFSLFRELNTFYVDDINPEKLVETGISEMLQTLDPYTVYYSEDDLDDYKLMTTGQYGGIGSLIRKSGSWAVISQVYNGFPADKAGIKTGDILKSVAGKSIQGLELSRISDRLKGEPGTKVEVRLERPGDGEYTIQVQRKEVNLPPVPYYGMLDDNTGYVRFTNFTLDCHKDVLNALKDLKSRGANNMILDVRGNPGGLLNEAVEIVGFFVDKGQEVVSTRGKVKQYDNSYHTRREPWDSDIPLVVMINRNSASASEILAGALQDLDRAVIVGQQSYGKGLVQTTRPLSYNTKLKVTTAKYYIPSGRCIQALDFAHRNEDGSVGTIPDSLKSEFKTRNGRTVTDGGGIRPDVSKAPEKLSPLTTELFIRFHIFDYATRYYWENPTKSVKPETFSLTDREFKEFIAYIREEGFKYETQTEKALEKLMIEARKEKYYELHKERFDRLKQNLSHKLERDINLLKPEILRLLNEEIVGRYCYQEGQIAWSLSEDTQIQTALEIVDDLNRLHAILEGTAGSNLAGEPIAKNYSYNLMNRLVTEEI